MDDETPLTGAIRIEAVDHAVLLSFRCDTPEQATALADNWRNRFRAGLLRLMFKTKNNPEAGV
jgi:hypothetical protein